MPLGTSIRRFLRSPRTIVAELAALALACAVGAAVPQTGSASAEELARMQAATPVVRGLVDFFAADRLFTSGWFLAITTTAAASLLIVVAEQFRRVRTLWSQRLTRAHFQSAPFRAEFERPAGEAAARALSETRIWSERRIGLTGSLLFHLGLLLVMLAGSLRALFATSAVVDLLESETLTAGVEAWETQHPGLLARPFTLDRPVTLRAVRATRYPNGELGSLALDLEVAGETRELAINRELRTAGGRLFLGHDIGPAALLEISGPAGLRRERVLLTESSPGLFTGIVELPGEVRAHLRSRMEATGAHPALVEARVMRGPALVRAAEIGVGETLSLPDGTAIALHGLPFWARLRGSHDPALGLAFAGLALLLIGSSVMFAVVKVDACVIVTPAGDREKVFVALRPHRFAPIFRERFEQLLREQGAPA